MADYSLISFMNGTASSITNTAWSCIAESFCKSPSTPFSAFKISMTNCGVVGRSAFQSNTYLTSIYLPNCSLFSTSAFCDCTNLTNSLLLNYSTSDRNYNSSTMLLPSQYYIYPNSVSFCSYAFYNTSLTLVSTVFSQGNTDVSLPSTTTSGTWDFNSYCFQNCTKLVSIYAPAYALKIASIGVFSGCTSLKTISAREISWYNGNSVPSYTFYSALVAGAIVSDDLPYNFGPYAFYNAKLYMSQNGFSSGYYDLNTTKTKLIISSVGSYAFYNVDFDKCILVGVNSIPFYFDNSAFCNTKYNYSFWGYNSTNTATGSMTLGYKNGYMGNSAFYSCSIADVYNIPWCSIGINAFYNCTSLSRFRALAYSSNVPSISNYAFQNCTSLTMFDASRMTVTGLGVFSGCTSLSVASIAFNNSIPNDTFNNCTSLKSVNICRYSTIYGISSIGSSAFYNCTNLSSFSFWYLSSGNASGDGFNNVSYIGSSAFYNVSKINVDIGGSATISYIGSYAFYGVKSASIIYISDVISICNSAFLQAGTNASISIIRMADDGELSTGKYVGTSAFYSCNISDADLTGCSYVGYAAFQNATSLLYGPTCNYSCYVGSYAFYNCSKLKYTSLAASYLGNSAYYNCYLLSYARLALSISSIGSYAFYNCSSLSSWMNYSNSTMYSMGLYYGGFGYLQFIGSYAFYGASKVIIRPGSNSYGLSYIGNYAFGSDATINGNGSTWIYTTQKVSIGSSAFKNNLNLGLMSLSPNASTATEAGLIGDYAFLSCTNFTTFYSVKVYASYIGAYAFDYCSNLVLDGRYALLTSYVAGGMIGEGAFRGCSKITYLDLKSISKANTLNLFNNCQSLIYTSLSTNCSFLNGHISNYAFNNCYKLTSIFSASPYNSFSSGITSVGLNGFMYCSAITSVSFDGYGPTFIGSSAFLGCTNLSYFGVTSQSTTGRATVSSYAFSGLTNLISASYLLYNISIVGTHAFEGDVNLSYTGSMSRIQNCAIGAFSNCGTTSNNFKPTINGTTCSHYETETLLNTYVQYVSGNLSAYTSGEGGIYTKAFYGCSSLRTAYLSSICVIADAAYTTGSVFAECSYMYYCAVKWANEFSTYRQTRTAVNQFYNCNVMSWSSGTTMAGVNSYVISVRCINQGCFACCSNIYDIALNIYPLKKVSTYDNSYISYMAICQEAFRSCKNLRRVAGTSYDSISGVQYYYGVGTGQFAYCLNLILSSTASQNGLLAAVVTGYQPNNMFHNCSSTSFAVYWGRWNSSCSEGFGRLGRSAFRNCYNLSYAYLSPYTTSISNYTFAYCSKLSSIWINYSNGVMGLEGSYAFKGTPFANSTSIAKLTVPSARLASYKTYGEWSKISTYVTYYTF